MLKKTRFFNYFIILAVTVFSFQLSGCGGTKPTNVTSSATEKMMKGEWTMTSFKTQGIEDDFIKMKFFSVADSDCFVNSLWRFIPNNATGSYTLNNANCQGNYPFKWNVVKREGAEFFQFKYSVEDIKDKNIGIGEAFMKVLSVEEETMTLRQQIPFEGKFIYIIFNFNRQN